MGRKRVHEYESKQERTASTFQKTRYGITLAEKQALLDRQGGGCAICLKALQLGSRDTCTDHCHKTNTVRGVLCKACNIALGKLEDDKQRLLRAVEYLRKTT